MQRQSSKLQHKGINTTDSDRLSISSSECSTLSDAVGNIRNNDKKERSVTRQDEQWKECCRAERRAIKLW